MRLAVAERVARRGEKEAAVREPAGDRPRRPQETVLYRVVQAELSRGVSYYRPAGVDHNVINAGDRELVFIEVEIKAHPISTSAET